jgi:hypothetical protein
LSISDEGRLDAIENAELPEILKDREYQEEITVGLEHDNIFEGVTDDEVKRMKDKPDLKLQSVDVRK